MMVGSYRDRVLCYIGLVLAAPSSSFRVPLPANRISGNEDVRLWNSWPHNAPGPDCSRSKEKHSQWDRVYARNFHTAGARRSRIKELESGGSGEESKTDYFYRPADLEAFSAPWGISLRYRSTLNTYRIEAYRPNGELAGYTTGFYVGDYLHLDKLQQVLEGCLSLAARRVPEVCILLLDGDDPRVVGSQPLSPPCGMIAGTSDPTRVPFEHPG